MSIKQEYSGDVRELSYDDKYAKPFGQSEFDIIADATLDDDHIPKPNRYYLLRHLGLLNAAEDLLRSYNSDEV